ncbi:MAG: histidine kinase [Dokdonella sp.]
MSIERKFGRGLFWLAYFSAWLALGLWLGLNVIIGQRNSGSTMAPWEPLSWELSSVVLMSVLAVGVFRFEARFPLSGPDWMRRLPVHLPAVLLFSLLHTVGMVAIRQIVYAANHSVYRFGDWRLGLTYEFQKDLISYAAIVGFCVAWRAVRIRRERELALIRLERDLGQARLAQLTAQIEPHFMFNTLNAISNRMHEDVDAADRMIAAFAELLRAALSESGSAEVSVADDVIWLERYFELMQERFRGQLVTRISVDPAARDARIPRLLLQPLVENAFEHGLRIGRGQIEVTIRIEGERLHLAVEDDGVGLAQACEEGTGLANVRSRLALLYPQAHTFQLGPRSAGGTRVEIDLPVRHNA